MKSFLLAIISSISLLGCGLICPEPIYIEYDYDNYEVSVLSEEYFIKSITLVEYVPKKGHIQLIDSVKTIISQYSIVGKSKLNILTPGRNYIATGKKTNSILEKLNVQFRIELQKFESKNDGKSFDIEEVLFVYENSNGKKKYNSTHPCP